MPKKKCFYVWTEEIRRLGMLGEDFTAGMMQHFVKIV